MSLINVKPRVFKNYLLRLGLDAQYQKAVSSVTLTPSASTVTFKGAHPEAMFSDVTAATWTCELAFAQDWETEDSLSLFLLNHEGEHIPAEFQPEAGGPAFDAVLIVTPGAIGGAIDAYGTATVTLGVVGRPIYKATGGTVPATTPPAGE
ncbi:MAG: hypothetical protein ACTH9T_04835 [Mycetocola reblochoni]|uniref:Uncharacterized protein n=2 Tax=Mycetocola reblochoni TaxID=331618 RepID=A0A1R4IW58_9MICO|nr:hypothetical protein [Mycetocola reblochoni]RLP70970.1 hypothetical protein D9V30_00620 [Mycetocola reblochoni]SJN24096.1 hypothetical protein FM119_04005 [Mycetocola reblochoni REB411]